MKRGIVIPLLIIAFLAQGCRPRVRPATTPAPAPAVPQSTSQRVEEPSRDFNRPTPQPARDAMAGEDLNRVARDRGWIRDAFFAYDSNTLNAEARAALDASARWLRDQPTVRVIIEGHCDERGTEQYNLALGDRRAETAREYLVALGVDPARISTISYGEERPFAAGSDEDAWQQNRRAHLRIERP